MVYVIESWSFVPSTRGRSRQHWRINFSSVPDLNPEPSSHGVGECRWGAARWAGAAIRVWGMPRLRAAGQEEKVDNGGVVRYQCHG